MIFADVLARLASGASLTALIGRRIFEVDAPDDLAQYPCITVSLVGGSSSDTLTGGDVVRQRVEVSAFAVDYPTADAIRTAVIQQLSGWYGAQSDGVNVLNTLLLNPGTDFVSEQRIFRCLAEFYVLYGVLN